MLCGGLLRALRRSWVGNWGACEPRLAGSEDDSEVRPKGWKGGWVGADCHSDWELFGEVRIDWRLVWHGQLRCRASRGGCDPLRPVRTLSDRAIGPG